MRREDASKWLLHLACTTGDRNAMNYVEMAAPYMVGDDSRAMEAVLSLRSDGPPDITALADINGLSDILFLETSEHPLHKARECWGIIKREAQRREIEDLVRILKGNEHPAERVATVLERAESFLSIHGDGAPLVTRGRDADAVIDDYIEDEKMEKGVSLGLGPIDDEINGLQPGQVMYIGGVQGVGKSCLGGEMLRHVIKTRNGLFVSMEMPATQVIERFAQGEWMKTHHQVSTMAKLGKLDKEALSKKLERLRIVDADSMSLEKLSEVIRNERRQAGVEMVLVDYLQRMNRGKLNEYEGISKNAMGMKTLAKRYQVPIVVFSQLNRECQDPTQPVRMHMFRGSGQIEESGDYVLGMWLDDKVSDGIPRLIVEGLKLRKGKDRVRVYFKRQMEFMRLWGEFREVPF